MEAFIFEKYVIFLSFISQEKKSSLCEDKAGIFSVFPSILLNVKQVQMGIPHMYPLFYFLSPSLKNLTDNVVLHLFLLFICF